MAEKKRKPAKYVLVKCVASNVWTSKGKMLKDDEVVLPASEVKSLGKAVKAAK